MGDMKTRWESASYRPGPLMWFQVLKIKDR